MRNHLISLFLLLINGSTSSTPDLVRLSLEAESAKWFGWLLISGMIVALGCVMEIWETYRSLIGWWRKRKGLEYDEKPNSWHVPLGALGLLLVIVGIVGETAFEAKVSNVDAAIREHESRVLSAAEATAGQAVLRAGKATERAAALEKETVLLQRQLTRQDLRSHLVQDPRRHRILAEELKPFSGTPVALRDCPGRSFDNEMAFLSLGLMGAFEGAGWSVVDISPSLLGCSPGIFVSIDPKAPELTKKAAEAVVRAFGKIGLMPRGSSFGFTSGKKSNAQALYLETPGINGVIVGIGAHP